VVKLLLLKHLAFEAPSCIGLVIPLLLEERLVQDFTFDFFELFQHCVLQFVGLKALALHFLILVLATQFLIFSSQQFEFITHFLKFFVLPNHLIPYLIDDNLKFSSILTSNSTLLSFLTSCSWFLAFFCGFGFTCSWCFLASCFLSFFLLLHKFFKQPFTSVHFSASFYFFLGVTSYWRKSLGCKRFLFVLDSVEVLFIMVRQEEWHCFNYFTLSLGFICCCFWTHWIKRQIVS